MRRGRTRPAPRGKVMARGGRARPTPIGKAMARGGRARPTPIGRGKKMAHGGTSHCGHPGQPPCPPNYSGDMGGYSKGGRTRPSPSNRRLAYGGKGGDAVQNCCSGKPCPAIAPICGADCKCLGQENITNRSGGKMAHGGSVQCPAGSHIGADGSCIAA